MNVGQLRQALQGVPDDMLVILSKDGEGNGYSPLFDIDETWYRAHNTWSGEISDGNEEIDMEQHKLAIVLWPTN